MFLYNILWNSGLFILVYISRHVYHLDKIKNPENLMCVHKLLITLEISIICSTWNILKNIQIPLNFYFCKKTYIKFRKTI